MQRAVDLLKSLAKHFPDQKFQLDEWNISLQLAKSRVVISTPPYPYTRHAYTRKILCYVRLEADEEQLKLHGYDSEMTEGLFTKEMKDYKSLVKELRELL
jgi:hypothetical protein